MVYHYLMNQQNDYRYTQFQLAQRQSLLTHLLGVTHYIYRRTQDELARSKGYRKLSINYQGFFALLAERDFAPGELAQRMLISKQSCSKALRELEKLGLIERRPNPADGRSTLVSLSGGGRQLLRTGADATVKCLRRFSDCVGEDKLESLTELLEQLCRNLGVEIPYYQTLDSGVESTFTRGPARLNVFLANLSNFCYEHLVGALAQRGFENLKVNYSQVLAMVGPQGARIPDIAAAVGVSKQAVGATVTELENLGYIAREPDPDDGRQVIIWMTPRGEQLMSEAQECVDELMKVLDASLAESERTVIRDNMAKLFEVTSSYEQQPVVPGTKIQQLAAQLREELGAVGARMLAESLLTNQRS